MKKLQTIEKFYYILASLLILLAVLVIVVVNTIFSSITATNELDEEIINATAPRLNKADLNRVQLLIETKEVESLDL